MLYQILDGQITPYKYIGTPSIRDA